MLFQIDLVVTTYAYDNPVLRLNMASFARRNGASNRNLSGKWAIHQDASE